jgi:hypothetical protein
MNLSKTASWWPHRATGLCIFEKYIIFVKAQVVIGLSSPLSVNEIQSAVQGEFWTACCRTHKHTHTWADARCCGQYQSGMSQHQNLGNTARKGQSSTKFPPISFSALQFQIQVTLLWIICVDTDITGQLLTVYCAFIDTGGKMTLRFQTMVN